MDTRARDDGSDNAMDTRAGDGIVYAPPRIRMASTCADNGGYGRME